MELGFLSQDLKCQSDGQGGTRREWNVHLPRVRMEKKQRVRIWWRSRGRGPTDVTAKL